ncbi:MAG: glycosyltransferase family 2 protein [Tepidanaerobacteraceae bacterium]|jgi:glycosyltransferase involved in cell wall biosynthesis|nr:glycosyltransferase family 2 protein [Tepidanaerobacter sp.]HQE04902.1 glycosyltransferase family 2 protein [Tepidanaerobacteraceae bacterium]
MPKIAVVIPAYDEEKTIGNVLKPVSAISMIDDIIVVSDGSHDRTANIARSYKARVIEFDKNHGKTYAVLSGVQSTDADIILMLDADLIGLTEEHVINLLQPVLDERADMTIGIFNSGRGATDFAQKIAPFLSGQRAICKSVLEKLEEYKVTSYGIEMALTLMAEKEKIRTQLVYLPNLTHLMKEEKRGVLLGFLSRIKMYWDILFIFGLIKLKVIFDSK